MSVITEIEGDLFEVAPEGAALIHACNCQGSWGKGIAEAFREKYPAAYQIFRVHCQQYLSHPQTRTKADPSTQHLRTLKLPEGTALIIPPQEADYNPQAQAQIPLAPFRGRGRGRGRGGVNSSSGRASRPAGKKHWIICLFTSWHYGPRNRSAPAVILENTRLAVADLKRQIEEMGAAGNGGEGEDAGEQKMGELWGCRFNSGLFGVPWEKTKEVLEEAGVGMVIVRPVGE
ncbi:ADP-ribose 1''-phosphate phosphatase [Helicocarpus griseus UAMH5409]|uniref:ADP-ribose 1''-phosphate phosphatase n=1 Tax=Helicocarpus griseus UAMH5409 TaxID=1447875 RepID=A0A2B7WIF2_9EURO|nr:ADP-ribose 1''-phosphate phosphatase [Helicocarpus griseus UAMH5409]